MNRVRDFRGSWLVVAALAGFAGAGTPGSASAQWEVDVAAGARQYAATCGRCHALRSPVEYSDRDWVVIATHMRARAALTGEQMSDILAFLQASNDVGPAGPKGAAAPETVERPGAAGVVEPSTDPATIERGRMLAEETGCVACHEIGPGGSRIAPGLNGVVSRRGASFVARKIRNPAFDDPRTQMPNFRLTDEEIRALVAYLATLE